MLVALLPTSIIIKNNQIQMSKKNHNKKSQHDKQPQVATKEPEPDTKGKADKLEMNKIL